MNNTKNSIRPKGRWVTRRIPKLRAALLVALAAVLVLAVVFLARGCGATGGVKPAPTATPAVSDPVVPAEGGTLSIPMPKNPETLNPLRAKTADMVSIGWLVYESLVRYDEQGRIVNGVAERFETKDGGRTWTFAIKKGIRFQAGGSELTAADVIYTYGLIKSYSSEDCLYKDAVSERIADMEAVDSHTVSVTAVKSGHTVLGALRFPILSKDYCSGRNIDTALPRGTGPYEVQSSDASGMVLVANANWWKQRAHIGTVKAVAVPDNNAALSSFEANELTMVPTQQITAHRFAEEGRTAVYNVMTQRFECMVPNFADGVLADLSVRRAIAHALDKKDIIDRALLGHAVATETPVPPGSYLFDLGIEIYEHNLKKADELLGGLGWTVPEDPAKKVRVNATGQELELRLLIDENPDSTVRKDMAAAIKDQLLKAGIGVTIETKSWDDYLQALRNRTFDLALCGFNLDRSLDLAGLLHSGGSINYSGYSDGSVNGQLEAYAKSTEEADRKKNMHGVQKAVVRDLPVISICFRTYSIVSQAKVQSVEGLYDMDFYYGIERWFIQD